MSRPTRTAVRPAPARRSGPPPISTATASRTIGNGDGTFQAGITYGTDTAPFGAVAFDLNGDGKPDIATSNGGADDVSVLINKGKGTFNTAVNYPLASEVSNLVVADFDLASSGLKMGQVGILLGNGDGTFKNVTLFADPTLPMGIATGDFNGDGKPDLATSNSGANLMGETVQILLNTSQ